MLHVIGLGLGNPKDITIKGLETIRKCDRIYLETYTSILATGLEDFETLYGREILEADRELVENNTDELLPKSENENVALLVGGDPFGATTHSDLIVRAHEKKLQVNIIHNASILTAIGCCGLQLYRFGETVSIPYWSDDWKPRSFFEKLLYNRERNLHTLCLLDIKVKEPTFESLTRKKKEYMPSMYMTANQAAEQLVQSLHVIPKGRAWDDRFTMDDWCTVIALGRVGWDDQRVAIGTVGEMCRMDVGPPPHCLIVPSMTLHPVESEYLAQYGRREYTDRYL
ncbi:diphthine methyl ester synthase [Megalopta genalis]|uniref:diphthine methyl ester synthase n=1 Tax=Megalopta genalis TaxID=115081 RepID=UPI003FD62EFF